LPTFDAGPLTFDAFSSDVKVQVEAEDTTMMQQLKSEDFVCFRSFSFLTQMCSVVTSAISPIFVLPFGV
jgi:hypothetical protein